MAEIGTINTTGTQAAAPPPSGSGGKIPKTLGVGESFVFGRNRIGWSSIHINGAFIKPHFDIPLRNKDKVVLKGSGLKVYNQVGFLAGVDSQQSVKKLFLPSASTRSDGIIEFTVPDLLDFGIREGGHPWLKLISADYPGADVILRPYLTFHSAPVSEEEKKKKAQGKGGVGQDGSAEEGKVSRDLAETFVEPVLEGFRDVLAGSGKKPVVSGQPKAAGAAPAVKPKPSTSEVDLDDGGEMPAGVEEQEQEILEPQASLNFEDASSIVGEYIDKTQGGIGFTADRQAVLGALESGDLSKLTVDQRNVLKTAVSASSPAYANANAQLRTAMEVVGKGLTELEVQTRVSGGAPTASGSVTAKATVQGGAGPAGGTATVSGTVGGTGTAGGEVSGALGGAATVSASAPGAPGGAAGTATGTSQVKGEAAETVGGGGQASAEASVASKIGVQAAAGAGAQGLKQNLEIAGEFLDKHPEVMPAAQDDRQAIIEALKTGNFDNLTPAQKAGLIQILQQQAASPEAQKDPRLLQALQSLQLMLAGGEPEAGVAGKEPSQASDKGAKAEAAGKTASKPGAQEEGGAPTPPPEIQAELDKLKKGGEPISAALDRARRGLGVKGSASPKGAPPRSLGSGGGGLGMGAGAGKGGEEATGGPGGEPGETGPQAESEKPKEEPTKKPGAPGAASGAGSGKESGPQATTPPPTGPQSPPGGEPGEKAPLGKEEPEKEKEKEEGGEEPLPIQTAQDSKSLLDADKFAAAEKAANNALNKVLLDTSLWVWGAALPTFGLSIFLGAIVGDLLWIFKGWSVSWLQRWVKNSPILGKFLDGSNIKVKLSGAVKANILAMNAVVAALIALVFVFVVSLLWGLCNSWYTHALMKVGGMGDMCKALDESAITRWVTAPLNSTQTSTGFQPSNNVPGDLNSTAQWTNQINATAEKFGIDACILRVVVQKESGGRADIIGCDCAYNGKPQFCPNGRQSMSYTPSYPFNWDQCSYGVGLTQWTIFQKRFASIPTDFRRWRDINTPSRTPFGTQFYTVDDFLNPQTSLDLTAQAFSKYLGSNGGSVQAAFGSYAGASASQAKFVAERMALYNLCKGQ